MAGRQPYLGSRSANTGRTPYLGGSGGEEPKKKGHGLLKTLEHVVTQTPQDLIDIAYQAPAGLYQVHKALAAADPSNLSHFGHSNTKPVKELGKSYVEQTKETLAHPLRHPGVTALTVLPVVGTAGRAALAGKAGADAARAGAGAAAAAKAAAKAAVKPDLGKREINVGTSTAKGHYSKSVTGAMFQKAGDSALKGAAARSKRAENLLHSRAGKMNERTLRVEKARARAAGTRLQALGRKLKPEEMRALRLVAEEVPVARRVAASEMRKAQAKGGEVARHQERIDLTRKAMSYLDEGPGGKPVFKPSAVKLKRVYAALQRASTERGDILKNLGLLEEEAQQAAKTNAARYAAGANHEAPTAAKLGRPSKALLNQRRYVERLQGLHDRAYASATAAAEKGAAKASTAVGESPELRKARQHVARLEARIADAESSKLPSETYLGQPGAAMSRYVKVLINPKNPRDISFKLGETAHGKLPGFAERRHWIQGTGVVHNGELSHININGNYPGKAFERAALEHLRKQVGGGKAISPLRMQQLKEQLARSRERLARAEEPSHVAVGTRVVGPKPPRTITVRNQTMTEEQARARLAELEKEHTAALDTIAKGMFGPIDKHESSLRSDIRSKHRKQASGKDRLGRASGASGRKAENLPTLTEERRLKAQLAVERAIEKDPGSAVAKAWLARTGEIDKLREGLNPMPGDKIKLPTETVKKTVPGNGGMVVKAPGSARVEKLGGALSVAKERLAQMEQSAARRVKPTGAVGAEDIHVSPGAPFIGNPAERSRVTGRPQMSSTGTFGHTAKPGSLKGSTGSTVRHARERNDVTQIVAERHHEAVRLDEIRRRVELVKGAGSKTPGRKDDVFMWTQLVGKDKRTGRNVWQERIPAEVRRYLDNPDGIAHLPEAEQQSLMDKLKAAVFERHNWQVDEAARVEFEKLAEEGKGVFVPRRLLGDAGKKSWNAGAMPGIGVIDAINNAQKAAVVYLKLNYPVIQTFSNVAMNLIQQGFAYPVNLARAAKLSHAIGPELAAVVDDVMGQGAVVQAALHGEGAVTHASNKIAHVMSRGVDLPARRAAFLHEAYSAGFNSPEKLAALLEDDAHAGKLSEIAQRAKDAIVDYEDLGPTERNVVRRLIFVYPWQKGAVKYAGHFLRDHPAQAAAVAALGMRGQQIADQTIGPTPSYLKGVFDTGGGRLVNPAGVNFFQTPAQIAAAASGYLSGNPASPTGQDFLAPLPAIAVALATRRDAIGRPLSGNLAANLRRTLIQDTPVAQLGRAAASGGSPLARSVLGPPYGSKTFPNSSDAYWRFLLGGLYPRQYDRGALNQNAAREKAGR